MNKTVFTEPNPDWKRGSGLSGRGAGKGSALRYKIDWAKYCSEHERIFGKKKKRKQWSEEIRGTIRIPSKGLIAR